MIHFILNDLSSFYSAYNNMFKSLFIIKVHVPHKKTLSTYHRKIKDCKHDVWVKKKEKTIKDKRSMFLSTWR